MDAAENEVDKDFYHKQLIDEVHHLWGKWDLRDKEAGDDRLQFDSFYHGFMAPYFGCYRCHITKEALKILDLDSDGYVEWKEFVLYIQWACIA